MATNDDLPREARTGPIFHPDWGTHAYASYNANTTGLNALLAMVFPEEHEAEDARATLVQRRARVEARYSGPWRIDVGRTMLSWQVAMRVSAVEVYLQDALTFLAVYDPEFIRKRGSEQSWTYDDVRTASDNDDILWSYGAQWAQSFIGKGGPRRWAGSLEGSGLGRFAVADVATLEAMWGYRHLRVHNAARLTRDFVARHQSVAEDLAREDLQLPLLQAWAATADAFVKSVEGGIAGRLRARLGPELIKERERIEFERQMSVLHERMRRNLIAKFPDAAARIESAWADPDENVSSALLQELVMRGLGVEMPPSADDQERQSEGDSLGGEAASRPG